MVVAKDYEGQSRARGQETEACGRFHIRCLCPCVHGSSALRIRRALTRTCPCSTESALFVQRLRVRLFLLLERGLLTCVAREHAYHRHSNFRVGAALLSADGQLVKGASIDNASYGATVYAERTAIVKAVVRMRITSI